MSPSMDELADFYERYIAAFNTGDQAAFAGFFNFPITVVHAPRHDDRRAGRPLAVVGDIDALWAPLPEHWVRSTIDSVVPLADAAPFAARDGLAQTDDFRPGILATVTRWHTDGQPYEHLHVLYLLSREAGHLGIKTIIELASARRPGSPTINSATFVGNSRRFGPS